MAEIYQFNTLRIPNSQNSDPDSGLQSNRLLRSQGTNSTFNIPLE